MITCTGCGGIVGRDCFSPQKCELKSLDQQRRATKNGADARIAELETALRAAQATIGGLEMEVARLTVEAGKDADWISVEDAKKPVGRTPILVAVSFVRYGEHEDGSPGAYEGVEVTEGEYVPGHGERECYFASFQGTHGDASHVTHWMPLPDAPTILATKTGSPA